jgi:hypothetical protein
VNVQAKAIKYSRNAKNYLNPSIRVAGTSMRMSRGVMASRYAKVGAGAFAAGTIAYGFTSRTGRRSQSKVVRGYRKTAHVASRTVAVPGQFAWGATKGMLNTGNPIIAVKRGASRAMTSIEGKNSASGRKNTLSAKQRRDTIKRNNRTYKQVKKGKRTPPQLTGAQRAAIARRRARDGKGRFR